MVGWMVDEWTDGLMDEWMEGGWKDEWIVGWKKNSIGNSLYTKVQSKSNNRCRKQSKPGNEKHSVNCLVFVSLLIPQPSYDRQIFSLIAKVEVEIF